mmetsp:Transcript_21467/g.52893  ORF Transcript_21467/g.52893 Transcript_21467/m.52893 type:complete len:208 (+) Transcript_21467:89-712(+)
MTYGLSSHLLQLGLEVLDGGNLAGHGCLQKVIVVPSHTLLQVVTGTFHTTVALGFHVEVEVMAVGFFVVLNSQQVVKSCLGERDTFVHGIQIIRIHGTDQSSNQVESLGVWQGSSLIPQDFSSFIPEIVRFGTVGCSFLGILHPFDLIVLVGTTDKSHWILRRVWTLNKKAGNLSLGSDSTIWNTITKEPSCNGHAWVAGERLLDLL